MNAQMSASSSLARRARWHWPEIVFWLMGSLADRSMSHVWLVLPPMLAGWLLMASTAPALDALSLGEDTAASLGFDLVWLRARLIGGAGPPGGRARAPGGGRPCR
mgnify:CR=1 FL=1